MDRCGFKNANKNKRGKIAKIQENEQVEVVIPIDTVYLQVTQFGVKSNELEVKDGGMLEVSSSKWYRMSGPLFIITVTILNLIIRNSMYRIIAIIIIATLYIISMLFIDGLYINVSLGVKRWKN